MEKEKTKRKIERKETFQEMLICRLRKIRIMEKEEKKPFKKTKKKRKKDQKTTYIPCISYEI